MQASAGTGVLACTKISRPKGNACPLCPQQSLSGLQGGHLGLGNAFKGRDRALEVLEPLRRGDSVEKKNRSQLDHGARDGEWASGANIPSQHFRRLLDGRI